MIVIVLAGGVGGWAGTMTLSGALIAQGSVVVDSNVKKVQHPTGGIVGELRVRDGDRVKQGDIVVRLDDTVTRANLAIVTKGLDELAARKARLESERDGASTVTFPADLLARAAKDPDIAAIVDGERKLFELRSTARTGQKAQLRQRIEQLNEEVRGLKAQRESKEKETKLIDREKEGVYDLWRQEARPAHQADGARTRGGAAGGRGGAVDRATAQAAGKISETELQIIQIDQDLSSEVGQGDCARSTARSASSSSAKLPPKTSSSASKSARRRTAWCSSPTSTPSAASSPPASAIMLIVPDADNLTVEAKVNPQDIDQVRIGQIALLRLSAFNQRTTPEIYGTVTRISADASTDQRTGQTYYTIRIAMPGDEVAKLGEVRMVPGMPVEAFVQTGDRTMISYLVKPLHDQLMRMFREK